VVTRSTDVTSSFITEAQEFRPRATAQFRRKTDGQSMLDSSLLRGHYADLYIKDNDTDTGDATCDTRFWLSPDLWVRQADDGGTGHQTTFRGQSNWIYARVRNKSNEPYENVTVNFYLANFLDTLPGTEFFYPVDWHPDGLLGSVLLASVPAASGGTEGEAVAKIEWTADKIPPATGWHPCLLCEILPMEVEPSGLHHVCENRKLAQRNLTILDPTPPVDDQESGIIGPEPQGYLFGYEFKVGHPLRQSEGSRLNLVAERAKDDLLLFLDSGELLEGLKESATRIDLDIPLTVDDAPSGLDGVRPLPGGFRMDEKALFREPGLFMRIILFILATLKKLLCFMLGILGICRRAPIDVRKRYNITGLRPVVLNGLPLLLLKDSSMASLNLPLKPGSQHKMRVFGLFTGRNGDAGLYHIEEEVDGHVVGGVSLLVNP
jgi:hypothetical protein